MLHNLNNIQIKIISKLISKRKYLREIAKEIDEIPSTTLRNIKPLMRYKLLDTHTEGKNSYYYLPKKLSSKYLIKIAENYNTLNFLKKNISLVPVLSDIIKKLDNISDLIIFGSYAKGTNTKDSDLDLLIVTKDNQVKQKIDEINELHNILINPKVATEINTDNILIKEIIKYHIILHGGEDIYEQIFDNLD